MSVGVLFVCLGKVYNLYVGKGYGTNQALF
jgi:hypothetical protein